MMFDHACRNSRGDPVCDICGARMNVEADMDPMSLLARKYATDKGGWHWIAGGCCHNYTPAYNFLMQRRRETARHILEIGINYGCSLRMWEEYFPNAIITGLDANAACLFNEGRIRSFPADQFNGESLEGALALAGHPKFDLIVDDGSHEPQHQIFSANALFHHLAPDGIYVIEDIYPDCKPELILEHLKVGKWEVLPTGVGLGIAHCGCPERHEEVLLVGRHG